MSFNYYEMLGIEKSATTDEIKKAYRKMSLKWHPDRCGQSKESEEMFVKISEAYSVLSNDQKRSEYDQFGSVSGGGGNGNDNQSYDPFRSSFSMHSAQQIFNMFNNMHVGKGTPLQFAFQPNPSFTNDNMFGIDFGSSASASSPNVVFDLFMSRMKQKDPPVKSTLEISMKEAYQGVTKQIKIFRNELDDRTQEQKTHEHVIQLIVKPGVVDKTELMVENMGHIIPGRIPSDLIFCVKTKPCISFAREQNILVFTHKLSMADMLQGCKVQVPMFDTPGEILCDTTIPGPVRPNIPFVIPNLGFPKSSSRPHIRDALWIRWDTSDWPKAWANDIAMVKYIHTQVPVLKTANPDNDIGGGFNDDDNDYNEVNIVEGVEDEDDVDVGVGVEGAVMVEPFEQKQNQNQHQPPNPQPQPQHQHQHQHYQFMPFANSKPSRVTSSSKAFGFSLKQNHRPPNKKSPIQPFL